jgi:hypothetical protein
MKTEQEMRTKHDVLFSKFIQTLQDFNELKFLDVFKLHDDGSGLRVISDYDQKKQDQIRWSADTYIAKLRVLQAKINTLRWTLDLKEGENWDNLGLNDDIGKVEI